MTDSLKSAAYNDRPIDPLDMILDGLIDRISGCSGSVEEEARAALSHWIWNPEISVPFLPDPKLTKIGRSWKDVFGDTDLIGFAEFKSGVKFPPPDNTKFSFIDLFAGIGGFRLAMQDNGGRCVFSSEWDKHAKKTYQANYGELPFGDIDNIKPEDVPDHDVLCAGFPCQPFSLAGVSKKNSLGKKHGFQDETQGTCFYSIKRILEAKRPALFFLENVKNLKSHDGGATWDTISNALRDELGYVMKEDPVVVDGSNWVPQHRQRVFIVGYNPDKVNIQKGQEEKIIIPSSPTNGEVRKELHEIIVEDDLPDYTIGEGTWKTLRRHKENHQKKGNGFGYKMHEFPIKDGERTRTISQRYHKDGAEVLIAQKSEDRPRKLTRQEALQLQGYPEDFVLPVSNTQVYRQIGNSVVLPAVKATAREIVRFLLENRIK